MILIGSTAIKYWFPDFPREPKDIDYIVGYGEDCSREYFADIKVEYLRNDILCDLKSEVLEPNLLYTLKASHLIGWDINFEKHMWDFQFLKKKGCKLDLELFYKLYNYWNQTKDKNKRSDLDMSAEEFFDNAIKTPHDYYHTLLNPSPTYLKVLKDGCEVDVCENKFNKLSLEDKFALIQEEVVIMAVERWPDLNCRFSYSKMFKKFILNHCPIWEGIFILENYIELSKCPIQLFNKLNYELKQIK